MLLGARECLSLAIASLLILHRRNGEAAGLAGDGLEHDGRLDAEHLASGGAQQLERFWCRCRSLEDGPGLERESEPLGAHIDDRGVMQTRSELGACIANAGDD